MTLELYRHLPDFIARIGEAPRTRFAPSPTGYLHPGHLIHAIHVWGLARAGGGTVALRFEDHDRQRSSRRYEEAILEDLDWLGLKPDPVLLPPPRSADGIYRQSDYPEAYEEGLRRLGRNGRVYYCDCSRRMIRERYIKAGGVNREDAEIPYDGFCRDRKLGPGPDRAIRIEFAPGRESFLDGLQGEQHQDVRHRYGDLLLRDRKGNWTYQYSVCLDDLRFRINLVIRGMDLLSSTGRQLRLIRMLGGSAPGYIHHPLLLDDRGRKQSKSAGDLSLRELRQLGLSAEELLGWGAYRAGLLEHPVRLSAGELHSLFIR